MSDEPAGGQLGPGVTREQFVEGAANDHFRARSNPRELSG